MTILFFVLGLVALVAGAELLVRGASLLALSFGVSPLVVGLTIVAFGTSAPEVAVSVGSALEGQTALAVGNVVGSNIFNVLFILGLAALVKPLVVHAQIIRQELPVMIGATILLVVLVLDGNLGAIEAGVLLVLSVLYTVFLVRQSRAETRAIQAEYDAEVVPKTGWDRHWMTQLALVIAGLGLLVLGSRWLVESATEIARAFGVSEVVIGLTIVAAGTSLPEVATSVMAAVRGQRDIAVGNVVGSCTFNIFTCLGAAGVLADGGLGVPASILSFDLWVMLAVAVATLPVLWTGREIARWEGGVFLFYYVAYTAYLVLDAQGHGARDELAFVMAYVVVPLTVITIVVSVVRPARNVASG